MNLPRPSASARLAILLWVLSLLSAAAILFTATKARAGDVRPAYAASVAASADVPFAAVGIGLLWLSVVSLAIAILLAAGIAGRRR